MKTIAALPIVPLTLMLMTACTSSPPIQQSQASLGTKPFAKTQPNNSHALPHRSPTIVRKPSSIRPETVTKLPPTFGVFPKPMALEPAVNFWRNTYAVWNRSEVAFHDDRYMNVIYEVMNLPGYVAEELTPEQKEMISSRKEYWKNQLNVLDSKLRSRAPLTLDEKQILAKIQKAGSVNTILPGASDRLRSQRGVRERFKRGLEISGRYDSQFRKIFREYNLPEDLAFLPHVESSFQASAKSSAGAVGMWQFTKGAASTFMPGNDVYDRRHDPIASTHGAARYLSYAYGKLGNWPTAITSYNHGIGGMKRAQNQHGSDFVKIVERCDTPQFGFASRNYYAQFLAAREIAHNALAYFREGVNYQRPGRNQYVAYD